MNESQSNNPPDFSDDFQSHERPFSEYSSESSKRKKVEQLIRESLKKAIEKGVEAGVGTINLTDKTIRGILAGDIPKELVSFTLSQVDETKNALVRVVAKEIRDFLQATDVAKEFQKALSGIAFEIKTEVRFKNIEETGELEPEVKVSNPKFKKTKS